MDNQGRRLTRAVAFITFALAAHAWAQAPGPGAQATEAGAAPPRATADLVALLQEGQTLFHQAANNPDQVEAHRLYREAEDRFQTVAEESKVANAGLFYNIGNTYYMLGDIGRSILFYRKAELLAPADPDLRHNLAFVRSQRVDRLPSSQASEAAMILMFWHYLLSPAVKLYAFIAFFGAALVLGALLLIRGRRWKVVLLSVSAGFAVLLLGSLVAGEVRLATMHDGVVTAQEVVIRKGDGTAYEPSLVDPLHAGTEFRLVERRVGWYRIELTDGEMGWVPSTDVEMVALSQDAQ